MDPEDSVIETSDDAPTTTPADDSNPEGSSDVDVDLDAVAADFEEQALADLGEPSDADTEESPGKGKPASKADAGDPITSYINKNYKGDKDAFLQSQYESRAEAKRLKEENETLKRQLSSPSKPESTGDAEKDFAKARSSSPDVQALDQEIKSIVADNRTIAARQLELINDSKQIDSKISELQGQLSKAEGDDYTKISNQIVRLESKLSGFQSEFLTNQGEERSNRRMLLSLNRDLKREEGAIRAEMDEREQEAEHAENDAQATREAFSDAYDDLIKSYSVDNDSKTGKAFRRAVRNELATYMESLGDRAKALDATKISRAVKQLITVYADSFNIKLRSKSGNGNGAGTKPRTVVTTPHRSPAAPTGNPERSRPSSGAKTREDLQNDPDFWRRRASAVFDAAAKADARRKGKGLA